MKAKAIAHSLSGLGEAWNATHDEKSHVRLVAQKAEKPRKCRICGTEMEHIAGSNVYVCHGMVEVPKPTEDNPDAKELKPCTNYALSRQ